MTGIDESGTDAIRAGGTDARAAAPGDAGTTRPGAGFVLLATILASGMAFMDGSIMTIALPFLRDQLGASLGEAQWAANGYTLTLAAFTLIGGAAGDAYGLRRVFLLGIALFGIASAACGLAWSPGSLILARAVQGIGAALMVPGSLALIAAHYPPERRGAAIGTWAAAASIAPALGPVVGGALADLASWRFLFLINVPFALAAFWLTASKVAADRRHAAATMDYWGGLLAVLGLGLVAYGLTALGAPDRPFGAPLLLGIALAGAAVLGLFLLWEARTAQPMMPLALFADRTFAGVNGLTLLLYFALSGAFFFLPTALIAGHGYPAALAGSVFLPFVVVMGVLSRFGGQMADRFGVRPLLSLGPVLTGLSFLALGPAVAQGGFWLAMLPVMLLMGLGMGITVAPLSTAVMNAAPAERGGAASGINNAVARVAGLLAVASLGIAVGMGFSLALSGETGTAAATVAAAGFGGLGAAEAAGPEATALAARAHIMGFAAAATICGVLAILAGVIGWLTTPGREDPASGAGEKASPPPAAG
ncbi:DHA2 family efflux MFS transporter permease subunit [Prosthecomicrobium pneumaticum]|uniref:EmrB/QacA subfamily drug resistance transporter n=1 Tax=Prosthecomicrobium pneumaticum TaxID=81895 RepID=A0A7W9L1L3_9HYPH|nr:DHA2 family efflux MFS transporter permease subunit [Prosthecomicrobium pneumaticum]MBB5752827.1 EmrB/QacA subfamily drug resistance transporter [Prosthecomicrobium pneumaticum]